MDGVSSGKRGMFFDMLWTTNEREPVMDVLMSKPGSIIGYPGGDDEIYDYRKKMVPNLERMMEHPYISQNGNVTVNLKPERLHITGDRKLANKFVGMDGCGGLADTNLIYQVCVCMFAYVCLCMLCVTYCVS